MTRLAATSIALLCSLLALGAGMWLGGHPEKLPGPLRDLFVEDDRALRAELIREIEENFIRSVDAGELRDASLKGIVQSLDDRFSHYFTPEEAERFRQSVSGEFEGVGMTVDATRRGLLVVSVFDDSPAERAGIAPEDVITRVDGHSIAGEALEAATARIKGEPGTKVRLRLIDGETGRARSLEVERARIEIPVIESRLVRRDGRRLAHIRLASFTSGAHGELRTAIDRARRRGARGIVLDLRDNGGGLLEEGVLVASIFIEDGRVVSTEGRTQPEREYNARGDAIDEDVPVVVLVNRGSASASEIVTGALRDRDRATIVGTRTFGKGVFQRVLDLSNGGALDLTVGSYFLPSGENISRRGIRPQVRARDLPDTERDEALPVALRELADRVAR